MRVEITDVFLRDGLQDEHVIVATDDKLAIAADLERVGIRRIEAGSFVHPDRVPQMADAPDLFARRPRGSARWVALALNARGVRRAVEAGVDEIQVVASASGAHSAANAGATTAEILAGLADTVARAHEERPDVDIVAGISTAFTCPFEGDIDPEVVRGIVAAFAGMGVRHIGLADTLGNTPPDRVLATLESVRADQPHLDYSLHLHNAHGRAFETVTRAVDAGIARFDAALGGFGGCPFAPGAAGNLDTLELVRHLHVAGHETGIDEVALGDVTERARRAVRDAAPLAV